MWGFNKWLPAGSAALGAFWICVGFVTPVRSADWPLPGWAGVAAPAHRVGSVREIPAPPPLVPSPGPVDGTASWSDLVIKVVTEIDSVPFQTRSADDPTLAVGDTQVDSPGVEGQMSVTKEVFVRSGVSVAEKVLDQKVVKTAEDRVVRVGSRPLPAQTFQPPDPSAPAQAATVIQGTATSYCLTGTTATGTQAGPGSIAVDPSVIKLGSHLYVSGYGYGYAVDTGGLIKGTLIDVWYTCPQAIQWGRRPVTIYVLDH